MSHLTLLAQAANAADPTGLSMWIFVIIIGIMAVAAVLICAISTGIKYAAKERELQHAERMKALENGLALDEVDDERRLRTGLLRLAFSIGVVVPICAAGSATGALSAMGSSASGITVFLICSAAAAVGVAGVASGAWLAMAIMTRFNSTARRTSPTQNSAATSPYRTYEAPEPATALR
jgi:hypothetical protein